MGWSTALSSSLIRQASEDLMSAWVQMNNTNSTWMISTKKLCWQQWVTFLWTPSLGKVYLFNYISNDLIKDGFCGHRSTVSLWLYPTAMSKYISRGRIRRCRAWTRRKKLWGEEREMLLHSNTTWSSGWWNSALY